MSEPYQGRPQHRGDPLPHRGGPPPHGPTGPRPPGYAAPVPPPYLSAPPAPGGPRPPGRPAGRRPRRRAPAGAVLGLLVVAFILVSKPQIGASLVANPVALLILAGIVAAVFALRFGLTRLGVPAAVRAAALVLVWLVLGYFLVWEGYYKEDFFPPEAPQIAQRAPAPTPGAGAPQRVPTGSFAGLDGHTGRGTASLYRTGRGYLVRLDDVTIGGGPMLEVYLVPGRDRRAPDDGAVQVSGRAVNGSYRGDHEFTVPAGTVEEGRAYTVLVWCSAFQVPVGAATLS